MLASSLLIVLLKADCEIYSASAVSVTFKRSATAKKVASC